MDPSRSIVSNENTNRYPCLEYINTQDNLDTYMNDDTLRKDSPELNLINLQSRSRSTWVDSKFCYSCNVEFTFYVRRHHCRKCGQTFCYKCSKYRMTIPECAGPLPKAEENNDLIGEIKQILWNAEKVRLCRTCAENILTLRKVENILKVFDLVPLTVVEYRKMLQVSKLWNQIGKHYLSTFREIQYKLPPWKYTALEKRMLLNHKHLITNHNIWMRNYRIAIAADFDSTRLPDNNNISCKTLMCSNLCNTVSQDFDYIILLETARKNNNLKREIITFLSGLQASTINPLIYLSLPLLVNEMAYDKLPKKSDASVDTSNTSNMSNTSNTSNMSNTSNISNTSHTSNMSNMSHTNNTSLGEFLTRLATYEMKFAEELYWELKIKLSYPQLSKKSRKIYLYYSEKLLKAVDKKTYDFIQTSERLITFLNNIPRESDIRTIQSMFVKTGDNLVNFPVPTRPHLICKQILIDQIKIKDSASHPLFLPLRCYDTLTNQMVNYYLLYKFEDIRQDQIVLKTIKLMSHILSQTISEPLTVITYEVLPTSVRSGLIEIIPDCKTLFEISKKFSITNYILENNREGNLSADQLRKRFVRSCAAYCVITYLLGVGDRHLDNIMVTTSGYLFHIDYGFIIGSDPKPMTKPAMRITQDMIDAMGGSESTYYQDFMNLSQKIHLALRGRLPLFFTNLKLLVEIKPPISQNTLTLETLNYELVKRFMYGENYEVAKMQLCVQLSSSSQSYNHAVIDFFHYHQREKTIPELVNGTVNWIGKLFK